MPDLGRRTISGWTLDTFATYLAGLREADIRLVLAKEKFDEERDRRYQEINLEREKALKIKETADRDALELARQIQTYKDEKANDLREQINSERGLYATKGDLIAAVGKLEATLSPLVEYIARDRGRDTGVQASWGVIISVIGVVGTMMAIATGVITLVIFLNRTQPAPIYTPAPSGTVLPTTPPATVPR